MIRIRVDDFPNTRDGEKDKHSLAAFREFHRCLSECIDGRRYLLGVIPGRCNVDDILFIRNETDVVVGMHGIHHDESKLDVYQNEFPPFISMEQVGRMLRETRGQLATATGRPCTVYMPPRNQIDMRTLMMLSPSGFTWFTSGPETNKALPGLNRKIASMPPHEYGRTDELLQRSSHIELMKACDENRDVVLTLHWTWETNIGLDHMRKFFAAIPSKYFKDFDV